MIRPRYVTSSNSEKAAFGPIFPVSFLRMTHFPFLTKQAVALELRKTIKSERGPRGGKKGGNCASVTFKLKDFAFRVKARDFCVWLLSQQKPFPVLGTFEKNTNSSTSNDQEY